ncbi:MAG: type II toxin-antitoxin system VapC family toxin [Ktedonobacterales bacterium]
MSVSYFFDTSALLPRFLRGSPGHLWVEHVCSPASGNTIALAQVTLAELAASLNQLVRGGILRRRRIEIALSALWRQVDASEYSLIPVDLMMVRRAAALCDVHSLKGYDAIQLACALTVRDSVRAAPAAMSLGEPVFLTEDNRLHDAALAEGFVVDTPLAHP